MRTLKELQRGGKGEKGGQGTRGEGKKTQPPDYAPWGVQCGAGKKTSATSRTVNICSPSNIELKIINKHLLVSHIKTQDTTKA